MVTIGDRHIGPGRPAYIVAEAGVNHDGDSDMAHRLVEAARQSGADAVKFQVFRADALVGASAPTCAYQREGPGAPDNQREMLRRLELPIATFSELQRHASELGIDFLATPFGLPELRFLVSELRVPAIKIASTDLVNVPLLSAAARSNLPTMVSTGAATLEEVDAAVAVMRRHGAPQRLILLHCISSYPTPLASTQLRCITALARRFDLPTGFSDHTRETLTGALAVAAGAAVLEKHLTLNRSAAGPDHAFSLEPNQFREYVAGVRQAERMLGDGRIGFREEEAEVRALGRGRLVACRTIPAGTMLNAEAVMVQRPGDGIDPSHWEDVIGRTAGVEIPVNTPLSWSMFE